ncbi:riboflavin kinase [Arthrobacter pigmenti]
MEHGDARGRQLGVPTANLSLPDNIQVDDGVWTAIVGTSSEHCSIAAVSIGRRTTFYGSKGKRLLEAHLLDFSGDIYGQPLRVALYTRLRTQRRFSTVELLVNQLQNDISATRNWAAAHHPSLLSPKRQADEYRILT